MASVPANHLFRICSSNHNLFRVRFYFFPNRFLHSLNVKSPIYQSSHRSNHPPPTQFILPRCQDTIFSVFNFRKHMFSTLVENENRNGSLEFTSGIELESTEDHNNNNSDLGGEIIEECEDVGSADPVEIYRWLCAAARSDKYVLEDMHGLVEIFNGFSKSGWAANQALAVYIVSPDRLSLNGTRETRTCIDLKKNRGYRLQRRTATVLNYFLS